MAKLIPLLQEVRSCQICAKYLPLGPRPVVQAGAQARLLIIGQAPGLRVHKTGVPFNDASGRRLREWLQISEEDFYEPDRVAIMPMGFCYPGKGKSGDLPPRPECAPQWHQPILAELPQIQLTLLVGQYAQKYYLQDGYKTLTERVRNWRELPENILPLPHPSPRNQIWLHKNPWFEQEVVVELRRRMGKLFEVN